MAPDEVIDAMCLSFASWPMTQKTNTSWLAPGRSLLGQLPVAGAWYEGEVG